MPIPNVPQPQIIQIEPELRLRAFDGAFSFALPWYADPEDIRMIDGGCEPYSPERVGRMYRCLDAHGELYFIEYFRGGRYQPVGDVTFRQEDLPIVIGEKELRGRGIGRKVIRALLCRAVDLRYPEIFVSEIYDWNVPSQRCFSGVGFVPYRRTENGWSYRRAFRL